MNQVTLSGIFLSSNPAIPKNKKGALIKNTLLI
jgi:hypothetical protein